MTVYNRVISLLQVHYAPSQGGIRTVPGHGGRHGGCLASHSLANHSGMRIVSEKEKDKNVFGSIKYYF